MAASINPYNFQRGYKNLAYNPFTKGTLGIERFPENHSKVVTNVPVHVGYTCVPLIGYGRECTYLLKSYVFNWSKENSYELVDKITDSLFQHWRRKRRADGMQHDDFEDQPRQGGQIFAANIQILNYLITRYCNESDPLRWDSDVALNPELEDLIIPPMEELKKLIMPVGMSVTTKYTENDVTAGSDSFVTAVCQTGSHDTRDLWSFSNFTYEQRTKLTHSPISAHVGFGLVPYWTSELPNPSNIKFTTDLNRSERVNNTKSILYKVIPVFWGNHEHMKEMAEKYTIRKPVLVKSGKTFEYEGEVYDSHLKEIVYKPYFWKVGKIGDKGSGRSAPVESDFSGNSTDKVYIVNDPCFDYNEMAKLYIVRLDADYLACPYIGR